MVDQLGRVWLYKVTEVSGSDFCYSGKRSRTGKDCGLLSDGSERSFNITYGLARVLGHTYTFVVAELIGLNE